MKLPALLATSLLCLAANLVHADAAASAPFTPAQQQLIRQLSASEVKAATPEMASAAATSAAKSIEGEKQAIEVAKDTLEVGRKSVDWWLTALGLLMAVAGIGLPIWLSRKHDEVEIKLKEAEAAKQKAEIALRHAEQLIEGFSKQANLIPNADEITGKLSSEVLEKLQKVKPRQVVALIEQAWEAHHKKDWVNAQPLWELLSLIESHEAKVWFNLGLASRHTTNDWQRIALYFRRANLLEPDASACNNLGNALSEFANSQVGGAQQQSFAEADSSFAEAIRLQPDYASAYHNRGIALSEWANTLEGQEQLQRFAKADSCFAEAVRLRPDHANTYNNWGLTLSEWATALTGEAQQQRFAEACDKYAKAAHLKSDDSDFYHNWAIALRAWAGTLEGNERDAKLAEAAAHQQKAEELERQVG